MSSYDDNPFGDPTAPGDDPFKDPAIQQITKKRPNIGEGLDDYNPFDSSTQPRSAIVRGAANPPPPQYTPDAGPAVMTPSSIDNSTLPQYSKSSQQVLTHMPSTSELQRRQEELDRKAAELDRREAELKEMEKTNVRRNNWPPLPENCCWQPCFYLDINIEIQPDFQAIVTQLYNLWQLHTGLLLANILGALLYCFVKLDIGHVLMAIIYAALYIPLSFLCWFRPGYKAFKDDSSFNFMVFFFMFSIQFIISIFEAFGFSVGYCGLIFFIDFLSVASGVKKYLIGFILLSIFGGFCVVAFADLYLLTKVHRIYRSSGASMAKARAEFTTEFFSNEHVRGAAANVAQAAVRQQFAQTQQPTSNRY